MNGLPQSVTAHRRAGLVRFVALIAAAVMLSLWAYPNNLIHYNRLD